MNLLNPKMVNTLTGLNFTYSHGGDTGYLGGGIFYYGLVYTFKHKTCYCLGSGAGFVPICMRQAQRDSLGGKGKTVLIDANLGSDQYGWPIYHGSDPTVLTTKYPEIKIIKETGRNMAVRYQHKKRGRFIDFMHIDANHSYEFVKDDFWLWVQFIKPGGFISLHDSLYVAPDFGVKQFVEELTTHCQMYGDMEIINFHFGDGTALVKVL